MHRLLFGMGLLFLLGGVAEAIAPRWFQRFMSEQVGDGVLAKFGIAPSPAVVEYFTLTPQTRRWWALWTRVVPGILWVVAARRAR
ncbi:MAG: hypothetical protein HY689_08030 [Chloroflexi bacterium]|nr:hypothetical protein [Chloroflexota bacterium]